MAHVVVGLPPGPGESMTVTDCPYRGLEFFDVQHAPLFFGRAAITDWLLSALRGTLSAQGPTRFLAIIGASGSGKSSLARAGLLAALKPGALPLLLYGLLRMWTTRTGRRITTADYSAVGQLEGIIEKRAEEVFQRFTEPQQELCRRLFLRLTEPGEGTEDTRRRVRWQELTSALHDASAITDVVKTLADERLLRTDGSTSSISGSVVEIAHETLIRSWQRLRRWIEADRTGLRTHRRLIEESLEWDEAIKQSQPAEAVVGLLYRTPRLEVALDFRNKNPGVLSELEESFLDESVTQRNEEQAKSRRAAELDNH